jgi:hypothetical protein
VKDRYVLGRTHVHRAPRTVPEWVQVAAWAAAILLFVVALVVLGVGVGR